MQTLLHVKQDAKLKFMKKTRPIYFFQIKGFDVTCSCKNNRNVLNFYYSYFLYSAKTYRADKETVIFFKIWITVLVK